MKTKKKYMGILYIIISAFCFALMAMFVRLAGDLPSVQKSFSETGSVDICICTLKER